MFNFLSIELLYQFPVYLLLIGILLLLSCYFFPRFALYQRWITVIVLFVTLLFIVYLGLNAFYLKALGYSSVNAVSLSQFNIEQLNLFSSQVSYKSLFSQLHDSMPLSIESGHQFDDISQNYIHRLYTIDSFGLLYIFIVLIVALIAALLIYRSFSLNKRQQIALDIAFLFIVIGSILMISSSHLMIFYLSLELISLPFVFLSSLKISNYFSSKKMIHSWIVSIVGSAFFLLGVGLYYANSHELTFSAISLNLATNDQSEPLTIIGLSFMFLSILFKLGLAPVQARFVNQVQTLPYPISLILIAVINVAIFCCLSRLFLISTIVNNETIKIIIIVIASCSIIFGNIGALYQKNLSSLIGHLYISFCGYLLIPFIALQYQVYALETINLCLVGNVLAFIVLYSILTLESKRQHKKLMLSDLSGLIQTHRFNSILLAIALLSIANIPLTIGFIGYFFLMLTAVTAHLWFFIALFILSTITGLYLCLKLIIILFRKPSHLKRIKPVKIMKETSLLAKYKINELIAFLAMFAILFFGFFPQGLIQIATLSTI